MSDEAGFDSQCFAPGDSRGISLINQGSESPIERQFIARSGALVTVYRPGEGCADIIAYGKPAKPQRI